MATVSSGEGLCSDGAERTGREKCLRENHGTGYKKNRERIADGIHGNSRFTRNNHSRSTTERSKLNTQCLAQGKHS